MKKLFAILFILLLLFLMGCKKCHKDYKDVRILNTNYAWIPDVHAPFIFESNGKEWTFPTGGTKMEYQKSNDCIEGCCENYYDWETRRAMLIDSNAEDNFQFFIKPSSLNLKNDSVVDFFQITYIKYVWLPNKPSVSCNFLIPTRLDSLDYWAKNNNKFNRIMEINENDFEDVYDFDASYISDSTYNLPNKIFYNKKYGIVGFKTLSGELWNRK